MDNVQVVELKEGCIASFDLIDVGFKVDGPAKVIILRGEPAIETGPVEQVKNNTFNMMESYKKMIAKIPEMFSKDNLDTP